MTFALDVRGVDLGFAGTQILHRVSFALHRGELCALLGPSGAGKSTLMRAVLGENAPDAGEIMRRGAGGAPLSIGYVPQDDAVHRTLSARAALGYAAELRLPDADHATRQKRVQEVLAQVGLTERADLAIRRLSGGQRKRVSLGLELLTTPDLLILDEPTSGLDPGLERKMMTLFRDLAESGRVVIVATHAMESLRQCHLMLMLVKGRVVFFGPPAAALDHFRVPTFAEVFAVLEQRTPDQWQATFARSQTAQAVRTRAAPVPGRPPGPTAAARATPAAAEPPPDEPPATSPDDELSALKQKMGLS